MDATPFLNRQSPESGISVGESLLGLLRFKNSDVLDHSVRVGELALEWVTHMSVRGRALGVSSEEVLLAGRLHDVGKIGIRNAVLEKPGPLNEGERGEMDLHPVIGFDLASRVPGVGIAALAILHHHERWDGRGYPAGLRGEEIPVLAQVIAIVDAYDAMTSKRCYQNGRSKQEAIQEIRLMAGAQFNPSLAEEFTQFLDARNA